MLINLTTTNIDFSNTEKALRQIHNNVTQLKDTIEMAMNNLDAGNIILDSGSSLEVAINSEELRGPQGSPGIDGFSPTATVIKSGNVSTLTVTDKNGSTTTNINDGINGADGFAPTITVKTNTETEYVLTITDKNGSYDTPNLKGGI